MQKIPRNETERVVCEGNDCHFRENGTPGQDLQPSHVARPSCQRKLASSLWLLDSGSRPAALPGMTNTHCRPRSRTFIVKGAPQTHEHSLEKGTLVSVSTALTCLRSVIPAKAGIQSFAPGFRVALAYTRLPGMTGGRPARVVLLSILLVLFALPSVHAHTVGISRGTYRIVGTNVEAELTFARPELIAAVPQLDTNLDGALSEAEASGVQSTLETTIIHNLILRTSTASCPGTLQAVALTEQDGLLLRASYHCPSAVHSLSFSLPFLSSLTHGHRHIVTATASDTTLQVVAYTGHADFQLSPTRTVQQSQTMRETPGWSFFLLGIEHILTGYDHLVFLLGLILVAQQIRPLFAAITAFTVAHSLTLGLAVLNVWAPSPRLIEPAIALSIVYVGVENWFVTDTDRRWLITLPFGLIHGFGFAGALQEIALPSAQIPLALATFNLGVEAGQIAALAVVFPIALWMHRQVWFATLGVKVASTGIALAGGWWFVTRVV